MKVTRSHAKKLLGKNVYAVKKDGSVVQGKLVKISGNQLIVQKKRDKNKKVSTKAFIPLVLFDLLAIGTGPYGYGYPYPYGYGYYGYPGYPGYF